MCQAISQGGRRCPVHRHDSMTALRIASEASGLTKEQTQGVFTELRREGRHMDFGGETRQYWEATLNALELRARAKDDSETLLAQVADARQNDAPDPATLHALRQVHARSIARGSALRGAIQRIADTNGWSAEEAQRKFTEVYNSVDTSRGSAVPTEYNETAIHEAREGNLPQDVASIVALSRLRNQPTVDVTDVEAEETVTEAPAPAATSAVPTERRVTRTRQPAGSFFSEMGYAEEGGRLEVVLRDIPDQTFAYQNVPVGVWEDMANADNPLPIFRREVLANPDQHQYPSAAEAEEDAVRVQCADCGQFIARNRGHQCPERPAAEETPAPTPARRGRPRRNAARAATSALTPAEATEQTLLPADEDENALFSMTSVLTPQQQRYPARTAAPLEEVARYEPSDTYSHFARRESAPSVLHGGSNQTEYHFAYRGLSEEDKARVSNSPNATFIVAPVYDVGVESDNDRLFERTPAFRETDDEHGRAPRQYRILAAYDSREYRVLPQTGYGSQFGTITVVKRGKMEAHSTTLSAEQHEAEAAAENDRLAQGIESGEMVEVPVVRNARNTYRVDGTLPAGDTNHDIRFGDARQFRRVINQGKTAVVPVVWNANMRRSRIDDQGYEIIAQSGVVTGRIAIHRAENGVMEVTSNARTLKCSCAQYARNYHCQHVDYVQRHVGNVAQQSMPEEIAPAGDGGSAVALPSTLARRRDIEVRQNTEGESVIAFTAEPYSYNIRRRVAFITPETVAELRAAGTSDDPENMNEATVARERNFMMGQLLAPPVGAISQALRRADVEVPLDYIASGGGRVTGTVTLHREDDGTVTVKSRSLRCTCTDYRENYDCVHVRRVGNGAHLLAEQGAFDHQAPHVRAAQDIYSAHMQTIRENAAAMRRAQRDNISLAEARVQLAAEEAAQAERRRREQEEWERRHAALEAERAERRRAEMERIREANRQVIADITSQREKMLKQWENAEPGYAENMTSFHAAYTEALARKKRGEAPIEFQTEDVTDGICADAPGARQFGVELEFDIKRGVDRSSALRKIGRELHAAGLTEDSSQSHYHSGARNGYQKWSFEEDCTVHGELVSPLMKDTPEHWQQLQTAVEILKRNGAVATVRGGSHVHVSTASYGMSSAKHAEVLRTTKRHEDVLYRLASDPSRGKHRGTRWCSPNIVDRGSEHISKDVEEGHNILGYTEHSNAVNFANTGLTEFTKSNIEYRMWDSTLDPAVIQQQVKISAALTEHAERVVETEGGSVRKPLTEHSPLGAGARTGTKKFGRTETEEFSNDEGTKNVAGFIDSLFRRDKDRAGIAALFAVTNWQKS